MSIKTKIDNQLNRLAPAFANSDQPQRLNLTVDGDSLVVELTAVDQLGCAFLQLALETDKMANAGIDDLRQLAERLSSQLTYLLEAISPIEVDEDASIVQLRSNPPHRDDDGTQYYELVVRRDGLSLCRYAKPPGQIRRVVPAHVTREVIGRLADDFAAAVG